MTRVRSCNTLWPSLTYDSWGKTLSTIHMWTQIIGKVRLVCMPWQNHSWHTTLYINSRGLTTGSIPYSDGIFEIQLDFENHQLVVLSTFEDNQYFELYDGLSVANFYKDLFDLLKNIDVDISIHGSPNEVRESIPFEENRELNSYDKNKVVDFWQVAVSSHNVFSEFRSRFIGKCSPVHLFWGAFDIAVTRFSGRPAPLHTGEMPNMPKAVMQEAYSQEVSSCGFWPGNEAFPTPIYYSYCYPVPEGFGQRAILPAEAYYSEEMGEFILEYEVLRKASDPQKVLMDFLQSTYEAAATSGNWDRDFLEKTDV